ncbi:MAG: helix-turn-helix domain-containing protein [Coriobacteriales bacterium]|jgi:hypothetical protein|nr:helix-turn-helix domain-containing protein [Coriobacteriales bacterium]
MKLNMFLIEHELKEQLYNRKVVASLNSDYRLAEIDYPLLLETLDNYDSNVVYITSEGKLVELLAECNKLQAAIFCKPFFCICIGKPPKKICANKWFDIIWIEDSDIKRSTLLNESQRLFYRFNLWEQKLEKIISNYGSISDLVSASLDVIKNDIWINDRLAKIIVRRVYKNVRLSDAQLNEIREGDFMPKNMIDDGNQEEAKGRDFGNSEPIFAQMQAYDTTTLSCGIHAYSDYHLTLAIHPNYQEVSYKDFILIRTLAHYIELLFLRGEPSDESGIADPRNFLLQVLEGRNLSFDNFSSAIAGLRWQQYEHQYLCLCCDFTFERSVYDSCFVRSHLATCERIQKSFVSLAIPYKSHIAVLVNLTRSNVSEKNFLQELPDLALNLGLVLGVSSRFSDLKNIAGHYSQASIALKWLNGQKGQLKQLGTQGQVQGQVQGHAQKQVQGQMQGQAQKQVQGQMQGQAHQHQNLPGQLNQLGHAEQNKPHVVARFEDHLLEYAMSCIASNIAPKFFVPKELFALISHDQQHGSDLYNTLRVYINNNCSATQSCEDLFIVRSSFIYRLNKIKDIMGLDLKDAQMRLLLSLSFTLLDTQQEVNPFAN